MTTFKRGDRVRVARGAKSDRYTWPDGGVGHVTGLAGLKVVVRLDETTRRVKYGYEHVVEAGGIGGWYFKPEDLTLLVTEEDNPERNIDAALAATKKTFGLCSEFDRAAKEADTLTRVQRLEYVATKRGRMDVFREFERQLDALNNPKPTLQHVEGEYVHFGNKHTGRVEENFWLFVDGNWIHNGTGRTASSPGAIEGYTREYTVISHGILAPGRVTVARPEKGRWIRAVMWDGVTREFEVTMNDPVQLGESHKNSSRYCLVNYEPVGARDMYVRSWEYVERPWKVGDVVPANTKVGRTWLGAPSNDRRNTSPFLFDRPHQTSSSDRVILWLDEGEV